MRFYIIHLFLFTTVILNAQPLAFPGAEGGGKYTTGGRGGKIVFVDNLNDKGEGSFRKAIEAEGIRTIIFRVSGNIRLNKSIDIKNGDVTIAGQSAPGDGICLVNHGIKIRADNVIIRFITVRPGDLMNEEMDAISGTWHKNIMIDHCSMSWASDEVASFYNNTNFTLQWSILSESLSKSVHHKGSHGFGGIWGGLNATFHHNLISDHSSRNPRLCGSRYSRKPETEVADIRNNVIYNWGYNSIYGGEEGNYNLINNYFKPGPATAKKCAHRILELTQEFYDSRIKKDTMGPGKFYIAGNVMEGNDKTTLDNWKYGVQGKGVDENKKLKSKLKSPVPFIEVNTQTAYDAYKSVLENAGSNLQRDDIDKRIINEVRTGIEKYGGSFEGGGKGIIDSQTEVGNWPELKSEKPAMDSDNDGMPDDWEMQNDLNLMKANHNEYSLNSDYTNIEVYLNSLVKHIIQ